MTVGWLICLLTLSYSFLKMLNTIHLYAHSSAFTKLKSGAIGKGIMGFQYAQKRTSDTKMGKSFVNERRARNLCSTHHQHISSGINERTTVFQGYTTVENLKILIIIFHILKKANQCNILPCLIFRYYLNVYWQNFLNYKYHRKSTTVKPVYRVLIKHNYT